MSEWAWAMWIAWNCGPHPTEVSWLPTAESCRLFSSIRFGKTERPFITVEHPSAILLESPVTDLTHAGSVVLVTAPCAPSVELHSAVVVVSSGHTPSAQEVLWD